MDVVPTISEVVVAVVGIIAGAVGYAPVLVALRYAASGRARLHIAVGIAAVALSFGLLTVIEGVAWMLIPDSYLAFSFGLVLGYVSMLTLMAVLALRAY